MEQLNAGQIFTQFNLSPEEEKQGQTFNELQRAYLHNMRADICASKLGLIFTPADAVNYAQQEAGFTMQIALLDELLSPSQPSEFTQE